MKKIVQALKRAGEFFDLQDAVFLLGLILLAYGLGQIYSPLAFVGAGAILVAMTIGSRL